MAIDVKLANQSGFNARFNYMTSSRLLDNYITSHAEGPYIAPHTYTQGTYTGTFAHPDGYAGCTLAGKKFVVGAVPEPQEDVRFIYRMFGHIPYAGQSTVYGTYAWRFGYLFAPRIYNGYSTDVTGSAFLGFKITQTGTTFTRSIVLEDWDMYARDPMSASFWQSTPGDHTYKATIHDGTTTGFGFVNSSETLELDLLFGFDNDNSRCIKYEAMSNGQVFAVGGPFKSALYKADDGVLPIMMTGVPVNISAGYKPSIVLFTQELYCVCQ